jgi:hypothetical protein
MLRHTLLLADVWPIRQRSLSILKQSTNLNQSIPSLQGSALGLQPQMVIKNAQVHCSDPF